MALLGFKKVNGRYRIMGSRPLRSSCSDDISNPCALDGLFLGSHANTDWEFPSKDKSMAYTRRVISQLEGNMKLSICKMDGTAFDVVVPRTATVLDLKAAVENLFNKARFGDGEISWQHVWENFCLCYSNQKLLDDSALLHQLGMREDNQLSFVRHLVTRRPGVKFHSKGHHFLYRIMKKGS